MADWAVRFYLDYDVAEAKSRDEAVEKAKEQFTEELQNNVRMAIPDLFKVAVMKNIKKGT